MFERAESILKVACLALAVLFLQQLVGVGPRLDPTGRSTVPEVPAWSPPAGQPGNPQGGNPGAMPMPMPPSAAPASPDAKRVDRITESGLLGPVIRPPPMALLGIVGPDVLLRAPNGQSGLVREGDELGGVKLLRIGTNRVLVEEKGQQKELIIFGGFGGESLSTKPKVGTL